MLNIIKSLSRRGKQAIMLAFELACVAIAIGIALALTTFSWANDAPAAIILSLLFGTVAISTGLAQIAGTPGIRLNTLDHHCVQRIAILSVSSALVFWGLSMGLGYPLPGQAVAIYGLMHFVLSFLGRVGLAAILTAMYQEGSDQCRVLIYGAGNTGVQLANALRAHPSIHPVAFLDDSAALQRLTIAGLRVLRPADVKTIAKEKQIDRVLLAMPSENAPKLAQIAQRIEAHGLEVQALPSFSQLIGQEPLIEKFVPLNSNELLTRPEVNAARTSDKTHYAGRSVMVTGAGGSIGSELSRQLVALGPSRLVLFEMSELALYTIDQELRPLAEASGVELSSVLGSVADQRLVEETLAEESVDVILHAAAYKHVPLVEANPLVGLANNVLGTDCLVRAAVKAGIERFILISSDKAVRPANVMGASKRLAEQVVLDHASRSMETTFGIVRFGNVLGSSGSVVPLFQDQIRRGGPLTVTDPSVVRYFMTAQEAVHLVLTAGDLSERSDIFVLDMGDPVSILALARQMIEASGYSVKDEENPDGDIAIKVTGLRPGEKLREELTIGQALSATAHEKIFRADEDALSEIEVASALRDLSHAIEAGDREAARDVIDRWVEPERTKKAARA